MIDVTVLDDNELDGLRVAVNAEQEKRRFLAAAPGVADGLAQQYSDVTGREDGDAWVQPVGAFDAYPTGATVTHNGKTWENLTPANVWAPPIGWREVAGTGNPPDFVQPTGALDAYSFGDRVTFEGHIWRVILPGEHNTVWSPTAYPPAWEDEGPAA